MREGYNGELKWKWKEHDTEDSARKTRGVYYTDQHNTVNKLIVEAEKSYYNKEKLVTTDTKINFETINSL